MSLRTLCNVSFFRNIYIVTGPRAAECGHLSCRSFWRERIPRRIFVHCKGRARLDIVLPSDATDVDLRVGDETEVNVRWDDKRSVMTRLLATLASVASIGAALYSLVS